MASARAPTQSNDDTQSSLQAHLREDERGRRAITHSPAEPPRPPPPLAMRLLPRQRQRKGAKAQRTKDTTGAARGRVFSRGPSATPVPRPLEAESKRSQGRIEAERHPSLSWER